MDMVKVAYSSKAVRVSQQILEDISCRKFQPGTMLPTESELARSYNVSRVTLRRSLGMLVDQKRLTKLPYQGIVVAAEPTVERPVGESKSTTRRTTLAAVWSCQPDHRVVMMREGIRRYAQDNQIDFRIFLSPQGHEQTLEILGNIERFDIDGVILLPFETPEYIAAIKQLIDRRIPVTTVRSIPGLQITSIETDSFSSGYQATHFLIDKYQCPVHFVASHFQDNPLRDRYAGYMRAMADAGYGREVIERHSHFVTQLRMEDPSHWPLDRNWLPWYQAGVELFSTIETPANIVCSNNYVAKGLYEAAAERKLVVGRDIRIVGIDDLPLAKLLSPPLTTINSPKEEIGYEAARLLHGLIKDRTQPVMHVHLPVELIIRDSA